AERGRTEESVVGRMEGREEPIEERRVTFLHRDRQRESHEILMDRIAVDRSALTDVAPPPFGRLSPHPRVASGEGEERKDVAPHQAVLSALPSARVPAEATPARSVEPAREALDRRAIVHEV